jgi:outer membrane protein TolC
MSLKHAQRVLQASAALSVALALGACTVSPVAIDKEAVGRRVADDKAKMFAGQEPILGSMSFPEVAARALKYNLDYRVRLMEEAVAQGLLDVSSWEMFPRLLANAGYSRRNNDQGGYSRSLPIGSPTGGQLSASPSQTIDGSRRLANVEFAWNILDFGVSYYRSKMAADQVLIAEERKRKVMQNMMQDTRNAYWRALGAQRLLGQMDSLMQRSNLALARARQIEQQGLLPQAQALAYQRALLDSTTLLQVRRQDLELAKAELAALMNLAPGTEFTLAEEAEDVLPPLPANISELEDLALKMRPELREEDYKKRISANDAKRAIVSLLPGFEFNMNAQRDSNSLLLNKNWVDTGFRLSANLFKLASIPTAKQSQEAQKQLDDTRRMAQAMAVLTQVRVASLRYGLAKDELGTTNDSANVDQRLANYSKASATSRVDSELEVIRTEARALLSNYQRHIAYANAQSAWGRLFNSVGYDINPAPQNASVAQLAEVIKQSITQWQQVTFGRAAAVAAPMPAIALNIIGLTDEQQVSAVTVATIDALNAMNFEVTRASPSVWTIDMKTSLEQHKGKAPRAHWEMTLRKPGGAVAGKGRYSAELPGDSLADALAALSKSALNAYGSTLVEWIGDSDTRFADALTIQRN